MNAGICPACGEIMDSQKLDVVDHLLACGVLVDAPTETTRRFDCVCGRTSSSVTGLVIHACHHPHDWKKILTTRELEKM